MAIVFISHSNEDQAHTQPLVERLRDEGFSVWIDYENIRGGAEWLCEIEAGIARCDALVVILSRASAASVWVERECLYAFQLRKPVLVALAADMLIPLHLINLQHCDTRTASGMDKLIASLESLCDLDEAPAYTDAALSSAPQADNFFPYLAQLPQGDVTALVARDLYEWAGDIADSVDFGGRRRPGFHARLQLAAGRATLFSVWAYPAQPALQLPWRSLARYGQVESQAIQRDIEALLPDLRARRHKTIPLRYLDSADKLEGIKSILLNIAGRLRQ